MRYGLRIASWCIVGTLLAISIAAGFNKAAAPQRGPPDDAEMRARGPIQKAFAKTTALDPAPDVVAPQTVPAPNRRSEL